MYGFFAANPKAECYIQFSRQESLLEIVGINDL